MGYSEANCRYQAINKSAAGWIPEIDTVSIPCASYDLPGRNPAAVATGLVEFFTKNDLDTALIPFSTATADYNSYAK
jgi:hypothetical protein